MKRSDIIHKLSTFGVSCHGMSFPAIQFKELEIDSSYAIWLNRLPTKEQMRRIESMRDALTAPDSSRKLDP